MFSKNVFCEMCLIFGHLALGFYLFKVLQTTSCRVLREVQYSIAKDSSKAGSKFLSLSITCKTIVGSVMLLDHSYYHRLTWR